MKILILIFLSIVSFCTSLFAEKARVIAKSGLILRAEPKKSSTKLDKLPMGTVIDTQKDEMEEMGDRWFQVNYNGKTGWVSSQFIDFNLKDPKPQTSVGKFVQIEVGDYYHLVIEEKGETKSFFILGETEGISSQELESNSEKWKGKKIKVTWVKTKKFVPEAGGFDTLEVAQKIELVGNKK